MQKRYRDDLPALLDDYELSDEEREAFLAGDVGKLYVLGANGQLLMHFAALLGMPWADYIEAMREGVRRHGPVRAGIYAMTTVDRREGRGCLRWHERRHAGRRLGVAGERARLAGAGTQGDGSASSAAAPAAIASTRSARGRALPPGAAASSVRSRDPSLAIEFRWAEGQPDRLPALVAELVRLEPGLSSSRWAPVRPSRPSDATTTVPVVADRSSTTRFDDGLVADLVRPGGNFTGVSSLRRRGLIAKRMELLKELVPTAAPRRACS